MADDFDNNNEIGNLSTVTKPRKQLLPRFCHLSLNLPNSNKSDRIKDDKKEK